MICFIIEPVDVRIELLEVPMTSDELTDSLPQDKLLFHD